MVRKRKVKRRSEYKFHGTGKYAPKMDYQLQCGLYAAGKNGDSPNDIATAANALAGVNRRSVQKLLDDEHRSYNEVKSEYRRFVDPKGGGRGAFVEKYYSNNVKSAISRAVGERMARQAAKQATE